MPIKRKKTAGKSPKRTAKSVTAKRPNQSPKAGRARKLPSGFTRINDAKIRKVYR
jgi:hypothetical protein